MKSQARHESRSIEHLPFQFILLSFGLGFPSPTDLVQLTKKSDTMEGGKERGEASPTFNCSHSCRRFSTLARLSIPMVGFTSSPRASTLAHSEVLAANMREILPLFLGAVCPTSDAW